MFGEIDTNEYEFSFFTIITIFPYVSYFFIPTLEIYAIMCNHNPKKSVVVQKNVQMH